MNLCSIQKRLVSQVNLKSRVLETKDGDPFVHMPEIVPLAEAVL